jgi:quaternary ammonium compound-resistance protein SugE
MLSLAIIPEIYPATKGLPASNGIFFVSSIWTGIGALGTVLLGILLFNEPVNILRIGFLFLILVGILGLKFTAA